MLVANTIINDNNNFERTVVLKMRHDFQSQYVFLQTTLSLPGSLRDRCGTNSLNQILRGLQTNITAVLRLYREMEYTRV